MQNSNGVVLKRLVMPYLKVPCPGCSDTGRPLFTEVCENIIEAPDRDAKQNALWLQCPRCDWAFAIDEHRGFWRESHGLAPLNGDKSAMEF